ncbi:MAG: MerR family transcriptional regulator [Myxococcota bacterium]
MTAPSASAHALPARGDRRDARAADTAADDAGVRGPDGERWTYRMKDLCEATGLQRQAIHFYIKEGLLPGGLKSSRNMAWYGEVHLERLRLVRRLQHERFLPLRAIKAVLDEVHDQFSKEQRVWLRELKHHTASTLARHSDRIDKVLVEPVLARTGVTAADLTELDRMGVVPVIEDADGQRYAAADDIWVIETLGELRALGFTAEVGFPVSALGLYEEVIARLFDKELELTRASLTRFSAESAALMVERVLPLVHRFLTRYHEAKIRRFFAALE